MEKYLPYFPLNISLLPGEDIPLRIFEPRYRQLINECLAEGRTFGIPYVNNSGLQSFGSECLVKKLVARNPRDEMVIVAECLSNFEVLSMLDPFPGKLYSGGTIKTLRNEIPVSRERLPKLLRYYTDNSGKYVSEVLNG